MTTRRWMIAIAVVASALASGTFLERRSRFLVLARRHEPLARFFAHRRQFPLSNGTPAIDESYFDASGTMKPEAVARMELLRAHYAGLVSKYRYAADHPWVHVEADPPAPK